MAWIEMTVYDSIGNNYDETRRADERILSLIVSLLDRPPGSLIADIGAGTGNYSYELAKAGYIVRALEPSEEMRRQGKRHDGLEWFNGFAEDVPFESGLFDGVICTLATHHFSSLEASFVEMRRIMKCGARLVIFTTDLRMAEESCWIRDYFKPQYDFACGIHPELGYFTGLAESVFRSKADVTRFPLPHDLADRFFYSAWRYPEQYLDAGFRKGISCFALVDDKTTAASLRRLESDLKSGAWDAKYGFYRSREFYDGGYYFLTVCK